MAYLFKKNKKFERRDGHTDGRTDKRTDERMDGRSDYIMPQILFGGIKSNAENFHWSIYFDQH